MKIKDIMTNYVISCDVNENIYEIAKKMKDFNIGFLPVVEKERIVGILTDRDIVTRILANNDNELKDYYTKNIVTIDIDEDINKALEIMNSHKIKRLLVTRKEFIVGVISISDILNYDDSILSVIKGIWKIENNNRELNVDVKEYKL